MKNTLHSLLLAGSTLVVSSVALLQSATAEAQSAQASGVIPMTRIDNADINLDGHLSEDVWDQVPAFDGMRVITPDTLEPAPERTETRIFYNDDGIYVGAMNYQDPDTLVGRMSSRDEGVQRDGYVLSIDTSGQGLYGYFLRINLGGTLSDGTILPEKQISRDWDGPWDAVTQELDNGWSTEMWIPWSMMTLPQSGETRQIGIYTERMMVRRNETWSWPALPSTNPEYLSGFQQFELEGINPRTQFTFYPYASVTQNSLTNETEARTGADLYWRPNSNTQVSATINPDFGTVESDDVVVNLSAFEVFFSEKRPFFLEGQEIFRATPRANGGPFGPTTILNTRRIGAAPDLDIPDGVSVGAAERNAPTDLLGAGKITGSQGNWRYGALLASEDDMVVQGTRLSNGEKVNLRSTGKDFAIGRLLYEDTSGGGRRGFGWMGASLSHPDHDATVNGVDYAWFSADTQWVLDGQFLHSDVNDVTGMGGFFDLDYRPQQGVEHSFTGTYHDDTLEINDIGYLQRNDFMQLDYRLSLTESGLDNFRTLRRSLQVVNQWNTDGRPVRLGLFGSQNMTFYDNTQLNVNLRYFPPRTDDRLSRGNGTYKIPHRVSYNAEWTSDRSQPVSVSVGLGNSQEDLGQTNINYELGLTWQPNDRFSTELELQYRDRKGWLVHQGGDRFATYEADGWFPEWNMNYFINAKQQFRLAMQWTGIKAQEDEYYRVDQTDVRHLIPTAKPPVTRGDFTISQLNFQARYRWEIAPLSDLFVVYTRGSNLPNNAGSEFQDLLFDAWTERLTDVWVVKLRYRLGS